MSLPSLDVGHAHAPGQTRRRGTTTYWGCELCCAGRAHPAWAYMGLSTPLASPPFPSLPSPPLLPSLPPSFPLSFLATPAMTFRHRVRPPFPVSIELSSIVANMNTEGILAGNLSDPCPAPRFSNFQTKASEISKHCAWGCPTLAAISPVGPVWFLSWSARTRRTSERCDNCPAPSSTSSLSVSLHLTCLGCFGAPGMKRPPVAAY